MQLSSHNIPAIRNYAEALALWEKSKPFASTIYAKRSENRLVKLPENARSLGNVHRAYRVIWRDSDGNVSVRYHDTDVVVYCPDGRLLVTPWSSMSTTTLVNRLLPASMSADYNNPAGCLLRLGERVYCLDGGVEYAIQPTEGSITPTPDAVGWPKIGKGMRAALVKHKYHAFTAWIDAVWHMDQGARWRADKDLTEAQQTARGVISSAPRWREATLAALASPDLWAAFLAAPALRPPGLHWSRVGFGRNRDENEIYNHAWREKIKTGVKHAIYHAEDVIVSNEHPWLASFGAHLVAAQARERLLDEPYERKRWQHR